MLFGHLLFGDIMKTSINLNTAMKNEWSYPMNRQSEQDVESATQYEKWH